MEGIDGKRDFNGRIVKIWFRCGRKVRVWINNVLGFLVLGN